MKNIFLINTKIIVFIFKKMYINVTAFFITNFLKINVIYLYHTHFIFYPFPYFCAEFCKRNFHEKYQIIHVRILTVLYTYRILLTMTPNPRIIPKPNTIAFHCNMHHLSEEALRSCPNILPHPTTMSPFKSSSAPTPSSHTIFSCYT